MRTLIPLQTAVWFGWDGVQGWDELGQVKGGRKCNGPAPTTGVLYRNGPLRPQCLQLKVKRVARDDRKFYLGAHGTHERREQLIILF
ncbi:hypothetical protein AAFF_G00178100 [Aldrovandia affinis]|uniref:Uncharacterized protein n=1 Tax=Aldrovandia affinis TaxID=143900 RepID=A0AAD7RKS7_9TELE|nr:hypothetical protein AAFF_G00178100 [Aldrovandia affinis]